MQVERSSGVLLKVALLKNAENFWKMSAMYFFKIKLQSLACIFTRKTFFHSLPHQNKKALDPFIHFEKYEKYFW